MLAGANLDGVSLLYARISRANFTEASLKDTNLRFAKTTGTKFMEANFQGANLIHTGMYKDSMLKDFPSLKHNKNTRWDDQQLMRRGKHVRKKATFEQPVQQIQTTPHSNDEIKQQNNNANNGFWKKMSSFFSNR